MREIPRHFVVAYVLFQLLPGLALAADPRWIRMASDDFEIFSTAGEGDTRHALEQFQQVSGFFESASHSKLSTNDPIRIIVFGSKKEYEPYKPNEVAIAYYTQSAGRDYIVLGSVGDDSASHIAVHEYVHLIAQHAGLKLPPWLNEGMAELYSTLRPIGGKIMVGDLIPGRMQALVREKWVPLSVILAADHDSPYYNEKDRAGSLYNEGWALTHMLTLTPEYGKGYSQAVAEIQAGVPSQQALEKTYGKPLAAIEKNLQSYIRGDQFRAGLFDIKLEKTKQRAVAEPASLFDVKLALVDLTNRPAKQAETRSRLEALVTEDPRRPEPQVALGYVALRARDQEKAAEHFAKAFELGSRNPKMLWDYGRIAGGPNPQASIGALKALLEQEPDRRDVRLTLGEVEMNAKQPAEALEILKPVKSISAEDAPRLFRLLAYAQMQNGNPEESRKSALRWIENTKDERDKENGKRLIEYLDNVQQASSRTMASNIPPPAAPSLTDPQPFEPSGDLTPPLPVISGTLIEMQCDGPRSHIIVESKTGRFIFLLNDPSLVTAFGAGAHADHIDITCGKQKPVQVAVQYTQALGAAPEVTGIAKRIRFEKTPGSLTPVASTPETKTVVAPSGPFAAGTLVDLDCNVQPARLILQTSEGRVALALDAPDSMLVYGLPDGQGIDISCGPQKPVNLWIEYDSPAKVQPGVKGLARVLHYEPVPPPAPSPQAPRLKER